MAPEASSDPYAELPASIRRANLVAHRQALLSDRMAAELHLDRMLACDPDSEDGKATAARVARTDALLERTVVELAALPEDEPDDAPPAS